MSGVWVVENPGAESNGWGRRRELVHTPSSEVITSYAVLEHKLWSLGWERYYDDPDFLQFHKQSSMDLISLPKDFNRFTSEYMYDVVVKNPYAFEVRDSGGCPS